MNSQNATLNSANKRLIIFLLITALFLAVLSVTYYILQDSTVLLVLMISPSLSVVFTRLVTKEGLENLYLKPNFKGNVKWYILAWFGTPFVICFGGFLYFALFPGDLDIFNSFFSISSGVSSLDDFIRTVAVMLPLAIIVNPIFGLLQGFGEEFAWRGYLLPKLCIRYSTPVAVIASGVIWGLWHAPIVATGYNFGTENPVLGVFAMIPFCVILGTVISFLFIKVKSVWVATVFHAAFNGSSMWAFSNLLMSKEANPFIGPNVSGIIGISGFAILAIICFLYLFKQWKIKQANLLED